MPGPATPGARGSVQSMVGMSNRNARQGAANTNASEGRNLNNYFREQQAHYPPASNQYSDSGGQIDLRDGLLRADDNAADDHKNLPAWMLQSNLPPAPYDTRTAQKDHIRLKHDVEEAARKRAKTDAGDGGAGADAVVYNAGNLDDEIEYVKHMQDQAELAKFDDYVSSMIDPREPGNLQWLMEVYPSFVTRRLQQAHSEYEFALRKQMIDTWGVNTFDDLHFLYMCDQGKFGNMPVLTQRNDARYGDNYAAGYFSPYSPALMPKGKMGDMMGLPFSSAHYGRKPRGKENWTIDRRKVGRAASHGTDPKSMAAGVFNNQPARGNIAFMEAQTAPYTDMTLT